MPGVKVTLLQQRPCKRPGGSASQDAATAAVCRDSGCEKQDSDTSSICSLLRPPASHLSERVTTRALPPSPASSGYLSKILSGVHSLAVPHATRSSQKRSSTSPIEIHCTRPGPCPARKQTNTHSSSKLPSSQNMPRSTLRDGAQDRFDEAERETLYGVEVMSPLGCFLFWRGWGLLFCCGSVCQVWGVMQSPLTPQSSDDTVPSAEPSHIKCLRPMCLRHF